MNLKGSNYVIVVIALIPLWPLLLLLNRYGVNFPYADHWALVPLLQKIDNGTFGLADLWAQHNEHRIVFPKLVSLILAKATGWYTPSEILFSVIVASVGFVLIAFMTTNIFKSRLSSYIYILVLSFLYFSPVQWENWLWGWQIEWFMCITSVIATVYLLERFCRTNKNINIVFAIVTATIATYSLGSGMLVWIIGLAMLLTYKFIGLRRSNKIILLWLGFSIAEIGLYYIGYHKPNGHPPTTLFLQHPQQFVEYFITTLGRPFTNVPEAAYVLGLIIMSLTISVALYGAIAKNKKIIIGCVKWYALMAFGYAALAVTAVARFGFGVNSAMSSRYTAFSIVLVIGLLGAVITIATTTLSKKTPVRKLDSEVMLILFFAVMLTPLITHSWNLGVREMKKQSDYFVLIKRCTSEPTPTDECLLKTYPPSANVVRERLEYVKSKNYAGY